MFRSSGSRPGCTWRLIDAYGVAMIVYLILWWTTGDRLWPVFALGFVAHLALPVAFVWLPIALLRRRWGSLVIEGICAVAFFWLFGDILVGRDPTPPPAGATTITVMTYNLGSGLATSERFVPLLREIDADVVGMQELTSEMAATLTSELSGDYPYQALHGLGTPGKGLLSRFPIVRSELLNLHPERPDLVAVVDVDGIEVTVIVAHPFPPRLGWTGLARPPDAAEQVSALVEIVETTAGPLLLLGDLNMTRMHGFYDRLESADMQDVYRQVGGGPGFTEPTRFEKLAKNDLPLGNLPLPPIIRIDYVWSSPHWRPVDAWVGAGAGSDHLPVVARIALTPSSG